MFPVTAFDKDDEDLIFSIIIIDAIYLIAFSEDLPTSDQIKVIQRIRNSEPVLQNSKMVNVIIADALEEKLANDFIRTANSVLLNMTRIINDKDRCLKVMEYAQEVALAGKTISPTVQNFLDRLSDALAL